MFAKDRNGLGRILSDAEIKALYDYQAAWFDVKAPGTKIVIDADKPVVRLGSGSGFVKRAGQVLCASAYDPTSSVTLVEWNAGGAWQAANPDQKGNIWCFTYQPAAEGPTSIQVRARDTVGTLSDIQTTALTVDGTPPVVTLDTSLTQRILPASNGAVELSGTAVDAASGVASLNVSLIGPGGTPLGNPPAIRSTPAVWRLAYPVLPDTSGTFAVRITATDNVGNSTTQPLGAIRIDSAGPLADITSTGPYTRTIGGTGAGRPTLTGTAANVAYPTNPVVALHFEETAAPFLDSSIQRRPVACDAAGCPVPGAIGTFGRAAQFSGGQSLTVPDDTTTSGYTIAGWVKPSAARNLSIAARTDARGPATSTRWPRG